MIPSTRNVRLAVVAATVVAAASGVTAHALTEPDAYNGVPVPSVVGPIPTTASSHPFDASTVDLAAHGYVEQEFFTRGTANLYDYDADGNVVVTTSGAPYENRIIVRRPANPKRFSGS